MGDNQVVGAFDGIYEIPSSTFHTDIACMGAPHGGFVPMGRGLVSPLVHDKNIQGVSFLVLAGLPWMSCCINPATAFEGYMFQK